MEILLCEPCEIKWGQFDAWHREKIPADEAYFALADKVIDLAHAQIATDATQPRCTSMREWATR